jgi:hypothetical protein
MTRHQLAQKNLLHRFRSLVEEIGRPSPVSAVVLVGGFVVMAFVGGHFASSRAALGGAILLGFTILVAAMPGLRGMALGAAAAGAAWVVAVLAVQVVPDHLNPGPPVADAVGVSAFDGAPYRGGQIAAVLAIGTVLAAGLIAARALRRRADVGADPAMEPAAPGSGGRVVLLGLAVAALSLTPDLQDFAFSIANLPGGSHWDRSNLAAWDYLVDQGLVPMKDFFYPYGHQWLYRMLPWGAYIKWLLQISMLALAAWALWRLVRRPVAVAICLIAPAVVGASDPALWRYLPPYLMAVTYAALPPASHRRPVLGHLAFGAACLLSVFVGPELLIYGVAGCAFVLVGELVSARLRRPLRSLLRGLAIDAAPALGAVALILLLWLVEGSAEGNLRFSLGLGGVSAASATAAGGGNVYLWPTLHSFDVAVPALLAAAGLVFALFDRKGERAVPPLLLGASGVSLVLLMKHLVRPVDLGMFTIALVALIWVTVLLWRRTFVPLVGTAFAAVAFVGFQGDQNNVGDYALGAVKSPAHVVRSVRFALSPSRVDDAKRKRRAESSFPGWAELAGLNEFRATARNPDRASFAVLGDAPLLYPILGQRPPYHVDLYDAARIEEQQAVLKALRRDRPRYLVWRWHYSQDDVPYSVRNPLVFAYAIRHYVPVRKGPVADVLRSRKPHEPIPVSYWQDRLGSAVALGFIPSYSRARDAKPCTGGEGCAPYALVSGGPGAMGGPVAVRISGRGRDYTAIFRARPGVSTYGVRLDRLWYWPLVGPRPKVRPGTPGWPARSARLAMGDDLY